MSAVPHPEPMASDAHVCENLARAARDGKEITPDIAARMRTDRDAAQRDRATHGDGSEQ